jgi:TolB-like protein
MKNRKIELFILSATLIFLSACQTVPNGKYDADIINTSHQAAEILASGANVKIGHKKPLIFASFVNINNLERSSSFGRIVSQQFATYFSSAGYNVAEMLLRQNVYIKQQQGEFLLSRELKNISKQHNAQAVVVGTYAVGKNSIYITSKMVNTHTNEIISSVDYALPIGPDTRLLLRSH